MQKNLTMATYIIGIDIGGTSTKWGIVSQTGELLYKSFLETSGYKNFKSYVSAVSEQIKKYITENKITDISGIGIGAPNGNYHTGNIEYAANLDQKGILPVSKLFEEEFNLPVKLTNDANAAAIGEKVFGNAKQMQNFVLLTLGTGLGSGIFVEGKLLYGKTGMAGELGHITVNPDGRQCSCGKIGCLEEYVSAKGIVQNVNYILTLPENENLKSPLKDMKQENITPKLISELAGKNDPVAYKTLEYTGKILGIAIADIYSIFSPEAVFLAGGISKAEQPFMKNVKKYAEKYSLKIHKNNIKILKSGLENSPVGILGAAALIING